MNRILKVKVFMSKAKDNGNGRSVEVVLLCEPLRIIFNGLGYFMTLSTCPLES